MHLGDALKRIFSGSTAGMPADKRQLAGGDEAALAASLQSLPSGESGWIMMAQAAALFRTRKGNTPSAKWTTTAATGLRSSRRTIDACRTFGRRKIASISRKVRRPVR
jgi:hypothetical protein